MKFLQPEILWFLPIVFIPLLVFLLRKFFAPRKILPSLVFFEEKLGYKKPFWAEIVSLALKCLALLAVVLHFAIPTFTQKKIFAICILDDTVRSGLNKQELGSLKNKYASFCDGKIYSGAALAQNLLDEVTFPVRNQPVWLADIYRKYDSYFKNHEFIFLTPENNYEAALEKETNVRYVGLPAKNNLYMKSFRTELHPMNAEVTQYHVTFSGVPLNTSVLRKNTRTSFAVSGENTLGFDLKNNGPFEIAEIRVSGDDLTADNSIFFPVFQAQKISIKNTDLSPVFSALARIQSREFPGYRISDSTETNANNNYEITHRNTCNGNCIILHRKSEKDILRYANVLGQSNVKTGLSAVFSTTGQPNSVSLFFTDGNPAIYRDEKNNIRIDFDVDAVPENVLTQSTYPYELLTSVVTASMKIQVRFIQEEFELTQMGIPLPPNGIQGVYLRNKSRGMWVQKPMIFNKASDWEQMVAYIPNAYASVVSGLRIPEHKLFTGTKKYNSGQLQLLIGIFFLLASAVLLLDFGTKPTNLQKK